MSRTVRDVYVMSARNVWDEGVVDKVVGENAMSGVNK